MAWNQTPDKWRSAQAEVHAKTLRRWTTDAERQLWRHLRDKGEMRDAHFRRQVALGPYVADFCSYQHRLIIEIDGPVHDGEAQAGRDALRSRALTELGFRILRFTNREVSLALGAVLDRIRRELVTTPTPGPSPQGGGELRSVVR